MLHSLLRHPLARDLDPDAPASIRVRAEILRRKPFLRLIYLEWYELLRDSLPSGRGGVLELGSGPGFLQEVVPGVFTSELFFVSGVRLVLDGLHLPFLAESLRAILMTDVFHHIPDARRFLSNAARCVRAGGVMAAIEPWVTPWSRFVFTKFHHEPFDPDTPGWSLLRGGPLSGANGALPWVVFERDRLLLERDFPQWRLVSIRPFMPLRYLISGGVSMRCLAPDWTYPAFRHLEVQLQRLAPRVAMFAHIVLTRTDVPAPPAA